MVTSNYIRLTPDQRSKQGALWNKLPCKVSYVKASRWKIDAGTNLQSWKPCDRWEIGRSSCSLKWLAQLRWVAFTHVFDLPKARFWHYWLDRDSMYNFAVQDLFGDGFAFWYSRDRMVEGPVFGSKDLFSGMSNVPNDYSWSCDDSLPTSSILDAFDLSNSIVLCWLTFPL